MKIFLDMVGCRLNQSEIEGFANQFRALGHEIVPDSANADLAIVNTCAVTVKAAADSRKKIRRAARSGTPQVVVTGCWATIKPEEAGHLPGVVAVIDNQKKHSLVTSVLNINESKLKGLTFVREALPGDRARTRAFIKVQEGCENACTYCLTRLARGRSRSHDLPEVMADIHAALRGGAKEIVLTGVQLGAWGRDLVSVKSLNHLIVQVLEHSALDRLRLSSVEPWDFTLNLLDSWADDRLCRHLHIPLQSGADRVLKRMGRPFSVDQYYRLVRNIRARMPEVALTTDLIVGFPGETHEDFEGTKAFIQEIGFAGGHVFTYSPRPGTAAYNMKAQVPSEIAKTRNAALRRFLRQTGRAYSEQFVGSDMRVLWESAKQGDDGDWRLSGLTDNYLRIYAPSATVLWNEFSTVQITRRLPNGPGLMGKILS